MKSDLSLEELSLYEVRRKVYPRAVRGWFAAWRWALVWATQLVFYGGPWLTWNERQAVLFDIAHRKFYIFGLVFWPQDIIYLTVLLILAALSLFLFTAVAGRLWCGYACPQTVYTEIFMWIERVIEGDRNSRMKLDKQSLSARKVFLKGAKHAAWIALALWTGITFVGYFTPIRELLTGTPGPWAAFWVLFYGFATYGNAGWMREQVCKYMCPYARFQSAMFDHDTLIVTYDVERGEPRGPRRRGIDHREKGLGDCIDCTMCVQVCPTGIDIRKGLQYECIACAACIDACDSVMDKMDYPRGLIRYSTERSLAHKKYRLVRPRTIVYSAILLLLCSVLVTSLAVTKPVILDVLRDRNTLYRDVGRRGIQNNYTIRVVNKHNVAHDYRLGVSGVEDIRIESETEFSVAPESVYTLPVSVIVPHEHAAGGQAIAFHLESTDGSDIRISEESRFRGPAASP